MASDLIWSNKDEHNMIGKYILFPPLPEITKANEKQVSEPGLYENFEWVNEA